MSQPFDAVVLLAHGAPDARWTEPFWRMRAAAEAKTAPLKVGLAFGEFTGPTLADAVRELYATGARRMLVVPVFLAGGGHVARDVPKLVESERERCPDLQLTVSGAIGEEPEVARAMVDAVVRLATGRS
jgi:sirohydrochlorin cobaltochelatase